MVASVGVAGCLGDEGEDGNGSQSGGNGTNGTNATDDGNATGDGNATDGTGAENETGNGSADNGTENGTGNESTGNETGSGADSPAVVVTVGPGDELRFDPESVEIEAGDAVRWRWEDDGHNVKPTAQPDGAEWTGTPGDDSKLYDTGFEYTHTFDVAGEYEYVCIPHQSAGMRGSLTVR